MMLPRRCADDPRRFGVILRCTVVRSETAERIWCPNSLKTNCLDRAERERVKQASRDLLASIKMHLAALDRFWEKKQTKAEVRVFILDQVYAKLPSRPFTPEEKEAVASDVYSMCGSRPSVVGLGWRHESHPPAVIPQIRRATTPTTSARPSRADDHHRSSPRSG